VTTSGSAAHGDVRLVERLGEGGHAEVWRAAHSAGRPLAVKMPKQSLRGNPLAAQALRREYETLRAVPHPHIVRCHALLEHGGAPALVLEYLGGGDLVPLLGAHPRHWLTAATQVLGALAHVHGRGFVHRDLKPRNVLFAADGSARLVDFSSALPLGARASRGGATAAYALDGAGPAGPEADCLAFAALLFELVYARLPFADAKPGSHVPRPPVAGIDAAAERLGDAARAALATQGRVAGGLSAFANVIESAVQAYR
jgi:serine/threonine protein kinase